MSLDIVIAGVGGQGTVLASRVIAQAALNAGLPVRTSETIGMAQREGTVTSNVRIGDQGVEFFKGAIIPEKEADVLIGFELAETVRSFNKLTPDGRIFANTEAIIPVSVTSGRSSYDIEGLKDFLMKRAVKPVLFNATALAVQAGNFKATNTVLLGAFSTLENLPFTSDELLQALVEVIPKKLEEVNRKAFELGRKAVEVL